MSSKSSINTFIKGMQKDLDKSVQSKDSYPDALNFRIVTSEGSSSGAFENIRGNNILGTAGTFAEDQLINGAVRLRDYLIVFTTSNTGTPVHGVGRSMILKLYINASTETISGPTYVLYDDFENDGGGADTLDFSTANPIKAIGRYETPNIQKVYFTDGYNNLRYINVAANSTITGGVHSGNNFMSTAMFEFLPPFIPTIPTLTDIVGGNLMGGMVQYSYQLYRLNGAETAFSPASDMIHLVSDNDFKNNTLTYSGDSESINTGKGCKLTIVNNNTGYNRLRLVRIHYSTLNSIPVIAVANEIEISTAASTVSVTDIGETISSLTLDEFNIFSTELFKCIDIATKDNRLFAANIEKVEFDVDDFDVRAVRFAANSLAQVSDNSTGTLVLNGTFDDWADYVADHDGISPYNDPDNDGSLVLPQYKYQADGLILGAEGPNVKIDFGTEPLGIDFSNDNTTFYTTPPTSATDLSYRSYASPWKDGKLSWQRDEVYRLSVIWGNDRGQTSDPKWIIDLRMPSLYDGEAEGLAATALNITFTTRLYPRIWFKDFPANATWAQIHRVKRERSDRFVVTQALAVPTEYSGSFYFPNQVKQVNLASNGAELVKLVSPEINITKNISKQANDYLEFVTYFDTGDYAPTENLVDNMNRHIYKLLTNTPIVRADNNVTQINDLISIPPSNSVNESVIINGKTYVNYNAVDTHAKGSTGLLVQYDNTDWLAEDKKFAIVNYKSNVFGSQYGGHTYEDRMNNIYIPCSGIITAADIGSYIDINYGDTFINYFDVSTMLYDLSQSPFSDSLSEVVYVPLESSINCDLRHDTESQHLTYNVTRSSLRQEYAGSHEITDGMTVTYEQLNDLYLYNTVYSQQAGARYAISLMLDTPEETTFDCLVRASNMKYNGENLDSWTKFNINEEIEVDSTYGAIRAIDTVNDKLLYWQEDAFGILSVNTRSLIQDSSSAQLALGTGGVLDRYDYISSSVGILSRVSIIKSDSAVYWFYDKDTSVYVFDNKLSNLSKDKGMWSWFKSLYNSSCIVHGVYDREYNETIITIYDQGSLLGNTIGFSEQTSQFEPRRSFTPRMYIDCKEYYISVIEMVDPWTVSLIYYHNSKIAPRCEFYGTVYPSTIKLLYNEDYLNTKVFDNIFYNSNSFDDSTDVDQYGITFDQVRCYNDYQNTDWVILTYPTNIMRRERGWTLAVPRNKVNQNYITSPDIFTDISTTKVWEERIRDKYMIVDLLFDNTTETRFVVPFVGIKYRYSYR